MNKLGAISTTKRSNGSLFPIVAVGASAGGLQAATELFKYIPGDTGMAYVYIQHLDRNYKSKLPEIIAKSTSLGVEQVKNNTRIKPINCTSFLQTRTCHWLMVR